MGPFDVREAALAMVEDPALMREENDLRGPVDPDAVRRFQTESGLALPPAVRDWLGRHNGGLIGNQIVSGLGTGAPWEIEDMVRRVEPWLERG
jgi:cell wall assembly regulator SMI1